MIIVLFLGEVVKPSSKNEEISHVSIETKDGYYLAINKERNILFLSGEEELTKSSKLHMYCRFFPNSASYPAINR